MSARGKMFIPACIAVAGLAVTGITACGIGDQMIDSENAVELKHATTLPDNVQHGEVVNYQLSGGAPGEYFTIDCPDGTSNKSKRKIEHEIEVDDNGVYIGFEEGETPEAIIIHALDGGEAIYFPEAQTSFIPMDSGLDKMVDVNDFFYHIARICVV